MWRLFLLCCAGVGLPGCAIHPLPDETTGFRTREIVHHIRCEARAAIKRAIIDYFKHAKLPDLAEQLEHSIPLEQLDAFLRGAPDKVRANVVKYERAAIGYDFTFDITEQNTVGAEVDFINVFSRGTFSIGPKGQSDLQRQTVRIFRVNDTFHELILLDSKRCTEDGSPENFLYPVAGTIGLGEMIKTFVDLNEFQNLVGTKDKETVPTMSDQFNFQTTISGSVGPQVTLTALDHSFRLAGASLSAAGLRRDIHKVIVAISLPPLPTSPASGKPASLALRGPAPQGEAATAVGRNNTAINDAILRSIINRLGSPNLPQ
jgi:hypothetical protein